MNLRTCGTFLTVFVLILLGTSNLQGQIMNIEKFRLDSLSRKNPFRLKLEANFDVYNRSATEEERAEFIALGSEISSIYAPGKHFYMLLGEIHYVENNSKEILNNGNLHVRSTLNFRNKYSPELFAQIQFDDFRGLNYRAIAGGAFRWNAIREKKFMLTLGAGPMYEFERWKSLEDQSITEVDFVKLSSNVIIRWTISTHVDFNTIIYYQVGYDDEISRARNRYNNNTNLNFRITELISFKMGLRLAYEDRPIVPITKFIYSVENGISLNF